MTTHARALLLIVLLAGAATLVGAQGTGTYRIESLDISASGTLPVGRYADHSSVGTGTGVRLNTGFETLPLELSALVQFHYLIQDNPYVDTLFSTSAVLEAGWPVALGDGPFGFTPRLGAGFLGHSVRGELNTGEPGAKSRFYADQIYSVKAELSFASRKNSDSSGRVGAFVGPGFALFPNQGAVGSLFSLDTGLRILLGSDETDGSASAEVMK